MFFTSITVEPRSARPSLLQSTVDAITRVWTMAGTVWGLFSPFNFVTAMTRLNRSMARALRLA